MNEAIEQLRQQLQGELDAQKSRQERNLLGQFATPYPLACEIVEYLDHGGLLPEEIRFLEPSIGTGAFYSALIHQAGSKLTRAVGYEVDTHYLEPARKLWRDRPLRLLHGDFLSAVPEKGYNLLIANPPYCRHHAIGSENKQKLQKAVREAFGLHISGLAGLYCYFLMLSTRWLDDNATSCWLIPSEFMEVNYGQALREFLCKRVELVSVHRFEAENLQFSDALVSSSVVVFKNRKPAAGTVAKFSTGQTLSQPLRQVCHKVEEIDYRIKWGHLFEELPQREEEQNATTLRRYFDVKRGVATGNNSFFIVDKEQIAKWSLPKEFLTPVLPSPRYLTQEVIRRDAQGLDTPLQLFLLSCPLPKERLQSQYPGLYSYILEGEHSGQNKGYNCQKRTPWYDCERRAAAPIVMTYMGRGDNAERMFRFILNETDAVVTNSYLMLYPKSEYGTAFNDFAVREKVWQVLKEIPKRELMRCGRAYGGGLYKIEPNELLSLNVPSLEEVLKPHQPSLFD